MTHRQITCSAAVAFALTTFIAAGPVAAQQTAQAPSCKLQAGDKKLAGAALTSFMKKCEGDAKSACDKSADDKKLAGAARSSFTKKCLSDATGS